MSNNLISKPYTQAPTTFQQDLDALLNTSTQAYTLVESPEHPVQAINRKRRWSELQEKYDNTRYLWASTIGGVGIASACVLLFMFLSNVMYGKDIDSLVAITCLIFALASLATVTVLNLLKCNQFDIFITNQNDEFYQFRFLPDDKLYIIGGANFDENGDTLAMNYITEMEPIYSDLIIMDKIKSISQDSDGAVIKGIANFRSYRINNGARVYIELEKKQHMTIFIQDGIYPEDMLETIKGKYNI
ncbi:MAG: hypothetical protein IKJ73_11000 [Lachnospiraceae bacterium]|nr:hypothetical protein [Lachnospiraceae bacterium]